MAAWSGAHRHFVVALWKSKEKNQDNLQGYGGSFRDRGREWISQKTQVMAEIANV